jgi:hypothetical protein
MTPDRSNAQGITNGRLFSDIVDSCLAGRGDRWFPVAKGAVMPRFVCITQPDGLWMVWDNRTDEPAAIGNRPLVGLEKTRAEAVLDVLERIETGKLTLRKGHSG